MVVCSTDPGMWGGPGGGEGGGGGELGGGGGRPGGAGGLGGGAGGGGDGLGGGRGGDGGDGGGRGGGGGNAGGGGLGNSYRRGLLLASHSETNTGMRTTHQQQRQHPKKVKQKFPLRFFCPAGVVTFSSSICVSDASVPVDAPKTSNPRRSSNRWLAEDEPHREWNVSSELGNVCISPSAGTHTQPLHFAHAP